MGDAVFYELVALLGFNQVLYGFEGFGLLFGGLHLWVTRFEGDYLVQLLAVYFGVLYGRLDLLCG